MDSAWWTALWAAAPGWRNASLKRLDDVPFENSGIFDQPECGITCRIVMVHPLRQLKGFLKGGDVIGDRR
ncbi:hypothetical protein ACFPFX_33330 [Streptomyces mauvecolor]|uniref:Uncharacterized protein n=1 Tax=Streptomyces mauvecolor TaxID=58345 RepID=A0ABV9UXL5_9ACTN